MHRALIKLRKTEIISEIQNEGTAFNHARSFVESFFYGGGTINETVVPSPGML